MPGSVRLYLLAGVASIINFIRYSLPGGHCLWSGLLDWLSLALVDVCRLFAGRFRAKHLEKCDRPKAPLILYEFEGCPYCRKVRETLSVLDIDHYVYPCPRETLKRSGECLNSRFRPIVAKQGGQLKFPFLIDPTSDRKMYESDEINKYLWATYGSRAEVPLNYRIAHWPIVRDVSMKICAFLRPCNDMGMLRAASHRPKVPLEIWGYEGSACVRRIRELLTGLELPYFYHELPLGSTEKRDEFMKEHPDRCLHKGVCKRLGLVDVPLLHDPNTKDMVFESCEIVKFLSKRYQTASVPEESWLEYGSGEREKTK